MIILFMVTSELLDLIPFSFYVTGGCCISKIYFGSYRERKLFQSQIMKIPSKLFITIPLIILIAVFKGEYLLTAEMEPLCDE